MPPAWFGLATSANQNSADIYIAWMQSGICACQYCCGEEFDLLQASMIRSNEENNSQMTRFLTFQEGIPALACPAAWVVSTAADPAAWSEQPKPLCSPASWRLHWRLPPPAPLSRCVAPPPTSTIREVVRYNTQRYNMERFGRQHLKYAISLAPQHWQAIIHLNTVICLVIWTRQLGHLEKQHSTGSQSRRYCIGLSDPDVQASQPRGPGSTYSCCLCTSPIMGTTCIG